MPGSGLVSGELGQGVALDEPVAQVERGELLCVSRLESTFSVTLSSVNV